MPQNPLAPAHYGTPEKYREFIDETLELASVQIGLAQTYCGIGDDAGLDYSLRKLIACVRAAHESFKDLKQMKADRAMHRESAAQLAAE